MTAAISRNQLMAKARGFTIAIDKMDAKQKISGASISFGKDYNNLRTLTSKTYPDIEILLPPTVSIADYSTEENYGDINTYCEQIFQLLSEQEQ